MAVFQAGDFGIDMTQTRLGNYRGATLAQSSPTALTYDFRLFGAPTLEARLTGQGFEVNGYSGRVSGVISSLRVTLDGVLLFAVSDATLYALSLLNPDGPLYGSEQLSQALSGPDTIRGGAGDEILAGFASRNVIEGGGGFDTVVIDAARPAAQSYRFRDEAVVFRGAATHTDLLFSVEAVRFNDGTVAQSALTAAQPFQYVASYADLTRAYGANEVAGWRHFSGTGLTEGRAVTFSGLSYLASYRDLARAYGTNAEAGAQHYLASGRFEGRSVTFSGLQYLAANRDLARAFDTDTARAATHYIQSGANEGRATSFDGLRYIASHGDLIRVLPKTIDAGAMHFITSGARENRSITFDPLRYIASNRDLIQAFGANEARGLDHWLGKGFYENRSATAFDPARYLANYADLRAAFGTDQRAATLHWIGTGAAEGRTAT